MSYRYARPTVFDTLQLLRQRLIDDVTLPLYGKSEALN
jgi:hypothetical protein